MSTHSFFAMRTDDIPDSQALPASDPLERHFCYSMTKSMFIFLFYVLFFFLYIFTLAFESNPLLNSVGYKKISITTCKPRGIPKSLI